MRACRTRSAVTALFRFRFSIVVMLAAFSAVSTGCLTAKVASVVNTSNAVLLENIIKSESGSVGTIPLSAKEAGTRDWQNEVARIDSFIESNPTLTEATVDSLRARQAIILTVHGQDNLAEAVFELVNDANNLSPRDHALYELSPHLGWWFRRSTAKWDTPDAEKADSALKALQSEIAKLKAGSGIEQYLSEMRA